MYTCCTAQLYTYLAVCVYKKIVYAFKIFMTFTSNSRRVRTVTTRIMKSRDFRLDTRYVYCNGRQIFLFSNCLLSYKYTNFNVMYA